MSVNPAGDDARTINRARRLIAATLRHLRAQGPRATAARIVWWVARRLNGAPAGQAPVPAGGFELAFEYDPGTIRPCGPFARDAVFVQEIPLQFDELHSVEVLLATYMRANSSTTRFTLLAPDGRELGSSELHSHRVHDNAYARVAIVAPVQVGDLPRAYLLIRSSDGTAGNAVTAWTSDAVRGRLWRLGASSGQSLSFETLGEPLPGGGLVYRLTGRSKISEPRYRWAAPAPAEARPVAAVALGPVPAQAGLLRAAADVQSARAALQSGDACMLLLADVEYGDAVAALIVEAAQMSVPVIGIASAGALEPLAFEPPAQARRETLRDPNAAIANRRKTVVAADLVVVGDATTADRLSADRKPLVHVASEVDQPLLDRLYADYRHLRQPRVSIVTILYNKSRELPVVLASYLRQTYAGEIELVFVDDRSPDESVAVVERFAAGLPAVTGARLSVRVLRNEHNVGNCESRNRGIAAATGDILIIIDADCMLNRDFVARHVDAHAYGDCEVVIGPLNLETHGAEPQEVLERYEREPAAALADAELQDRANLSSFLNCITRNFSIRRSALPGEPLFDPLFGYSADPASGFGWEDVEMGYRLYVAGARIKFVAEAFSIHVSAPPAPEGSKPARSLLNFARLLDKHPQLAWVSARWVHETYGRIVDWAARTEVDVSAHRRRVDARLADIPQRKPMLRTGARRLRVLTYRWHVPHQYELWKLPLDVTLATGTGSGMCDRWEYGQRPLPPNARFRPVEQIDPRDFDLAILHFDENVLAPENCNGVVGPEWGRAFRWLRALDGLPKIAICHGTPQFRGQYDFDYAGSDLMQPIDAERQRLVDDLAEVHVVCNSHQAQAEWQFRRSSVIWHGFDPAEFPPATYQRGILSPLGPLVLSRPHYRGYFVYRQVFEGLYAELRPETLRVPEPHPGYVANTHARAKFQRYVDEIRRYSVYFNPTLRSPMPRARCEPMMCGVVTVSARNHDVDRFIDNGVDGFHSAEPVELRDQLLYLHRHPEAVRRMGAAARQKALQVFHVDRYHADWARLISQVCGAAAGGLSYTTRVTR